MKRQIFTLVLCALFSTALMAQAPSAVIKKATTAPVIDGQIDDVWADAEANNIDLPFQLEVPSLGASGETTWKALWTDQGFYILLQVTDDAFYPNYAVTPAGNNYEYDKPEIYFDVNADLADGIGPGTAGSGHWQVAPGFTDGSNDGTAITLADGVIYAFLVTEPNYVGEYFVPFAKLLDKDGYEVMQTATIGFDVTIIDRESEDLARKRAVWANIGAIGESYGNMNDCGTITLEGAADAILAESVTISSEGDATAIDTEAGTLQFSASILPLDASVKTVSWSVQNGTGRARISSDGLLTAVSDGTVTVTGSTKDGSFLEESIEITISNQFISMSDIEVIKNGNFDLVNANGEATSWGGWGDLGAPLPQIVDGVAVCTPVPAPNVWQYQFSQDNLTALPNVEYVFSFVAWAAADRAFVADFEDIAANGNARYGVSSDPEAVTSGGGTSEWHFNLTTEPTRFIFHVLFDRILPSTVQKVIFMASQVDASVEASIDSVSLINTADLAMLGVAVSEITVTSAGDATTIETDLGTLQMSASVLPIEATIQNVNWSVVNGTGKASVSADGLVSAIGNGTVTVTATAADGEGASASLEITISNQLGAFLGPVVENFESLKMNLMDAGANASFTVVPNPDPTGANTSANVVEFVRGMDGQPWAGFYGTLATPVDFSANKYVHVKVWKSRISPLTFKIEGGETGNIEINPINPQTIVNGWEELVFDYSAATGDYTKIVFSPDREDPVTLTEDITLYFDDLTANNDPTVGSAAVQVMENYENIPLNPMLGGATDLSTFSIFPNPDVSGVNLSPYVCMFLRDKDGVPWGGFWSALPGVIDVTTDKFVHVKVWKSRISPMKFKIEGGAAGTVEIASKYPQTKINEWEDMVFDFTAKTGTYPTISFMPDFEDPLTLTEDITIYFDDIILNNDPNPATTPVQVITVDMTGEDMTALPQVFISGALGGIWGSWSTPGNNANNEMFDPDGDGIYTITMNLPDGIIAFKFFKGIGWDGGEGVSADRNYPVSGSVYLHCVFGVDGVTVSVPKNTLAGKIQMYPNPVNNELYIKTTANVSRVTITTMLGQVVDSYDLNSRDNTTINTSALSKGMYFVTFVGKDGSKLTQKLMKK